MATIFISYSHQDETPWKDFVVSHLEVAERQGVFDVWNDRRIRGGGDWQAEIDAALAKADIAVLLISRHFLTSDFILDHEVRTMLQRHASRDMILYPILISDCTWNRVPWLQALNIRPTDGTPLNSLPEAECDQAMTDMALEIGRILHADDDVNAFSQSSSRRQKHRSGAKERSLGWWRSADVATRATVPGTLFVVVALIWAVMSGITTGGDQINADCSSVNTGNIEGVEIDVDC
ncbi:MAG: toll/interleukin-1 receptor domain-containing protein [Geminicoccaceae bacterium]